MCQRLLSCIVFCRFLLDAVSQGLHGRSERVSQSRSLSLRVPAPMILTRTSLVHAPPQLLELALIVWYATSKTKSRLPRTSGCSCPTQFAMMMKWQHHLIVMMIAGMDRTEQGRRSLVDMNDSFRGSLVDTDKRSLVDMSNLLRCGLFTMVCT